MVDCVFCKIAAGEIPAQKVYEDQDYLAFLDIAPNTKGHTLVVPKEHFANFTEMDAESAANLIKVVHRLAPQIAGLLQAAGFNLGLNNGKAAGQVIDHVHWHVIPRYLNDDLVHWQTKEEEKEKLDETFQSLSGKIQ